MRKLLFLQVLLLIFPFLTLRAQESVPQPQASAVPTEINKVDESAELKVIQEAEAKAKQDAEAKSKQEAETKAKLEAEAKSKQEAEAKAKLEAEAKAKEDADAKAKQEAETKAKLEAEAKAKQEDEARRQAVVKAKLVAQAQAQQVAKTKAKEESSSANKTQEENKKNLDGQKNFVLILSMILGGIVFFVVVIFLRKSKGSNMSFKNLSLKVKLISSFIALGLIPLAIIALLSVQSTSKLAVGMTKEKLNAVATIKGHNTESYFENIRGQVLSLAENGMTIQAMKQFAYSFGQMDASNGKDYDANLAANEQALKARYDYQAAHIKGASSTSTARWMPTDRNSKILQTLYIANNPNPIGSKEKLNAATDSSAYTKLHEKFHPIFRGYLQKFGYYDIFLIEAKTGNIVYSVFKEVDYATSLSTGPYQNTNLARAVQKAIKAGKKEEVYLEDFERYEPSYNDPAAFIATPIYDGEQLVGVLAFQLPVDRLNAMVQESTGMGQTGQSFIVGKDNLMRTSSRFSKESTILNQKVETDATQAVFSNVEEIIQNKDYRGKTVWTSANLLHIPGLDWAMISEVEDSEMMQPINKLSWTILLIAIVIAVIVGIIGFLVSQMIVTPINKLVVSLRDISEGEGDLTKRIDIRSQDELGQLAKWFNVFIEKIETIIVQVKDASQQLTAATDEVSSSAQKISDGAQQQSASFEELSSSVQSNSTNASSANELAQVVSTNAEKTGAGMGNTIEAMGSIENSSKQITEAVNIITDIADQTNLLALNAAIEAARAGEHGKGFAVVADEVRKLAERSATSAKDIKNLIEGSAGQVQSGVHLAKDAGDSLKGMVTDISKVAEQLKSISSATQEQAATMEENTSITESNAAAAEELAASAEQMAAQSQELENLVGRFKVNDAHGRQPQDTANTSRAAKNNGRKYRSAARV